jgi:hypothetical protein
MSDTETLIDVCVADKKAQDPVNESSDFPSMGVDLIKRINFKVALFLLFIGLFVFSDVFIENVLPTNYQDGTNCPNTQGTATQLIILVLLYIVIDLLSQGGIL